MYLYKILKKGLKAKSHLVICFTNYFYLEKERNYIRSGLSWKIQGRKLQIFLHVLVCISYKYALNSIAGSFWLHLRFRQVERMWKDIQRIFFWAGKERETLSARVKCE